MLENDRIWITGAEGQLGHTLYKTLEDAARDILTTDKDVDVTDLDGIMQYADRNQMCIRDSFRGAEYLFL